MSDIITTDQAAAMLGVSRRRVQAMAAAGVIVAAKFGRALAVDAASVRKAKRRADLRYRGKSG